MDITWSSKQDAIHNELVPALGDYAGDYDLEAIFAECFEYTGNGFRQHADAEEFWASVDRHQSLDTDRR